jgi:type II secretory pathway predicted ATPase ExeA
MYKNFFGLIRNPFEISPNPYFLFPTARYQEALGSVVHGALRRKGFMVITGEVGTGKTLLVRCLLEFLRRHEIASANVFNPSLSRLEFLRYIAGDLGISPAGQDKGSLLRELYKYLIALYRKNTTAVVVVDEAQDLALGLLEEIRLLTNLETSQQKLLQIVLVGQPELDQKLDSPQLRQLKQRVALRCQLQPLHEDETRGYILRRLQRAGANSHAPLIFPDETLAAVYRFSRGVPRLINTVCENALIIAYAEKTRVVHPGIIEEVAKDLRLNVTTRLPVVAPEATEKQRAIARSLLEVVEALERLASSTGVRETSPVQGVKVV